MKKIISIIRTLLVLYTALIFMSIYPMLITVGCESFDWTKWLDADQYFVRPIYIYIINPCVTYICDFCCVDGTRQKKSKIDCLIP